MLEACCTINSFYIYPWPKYKGIVPEALPYVTEWKSLAKDRGLIFPDNVTIGFDNIKEGGIIGYCAYGSNFREITLDRNQWNGYDEISKMSLLFHELNHCYCGRGHDYVINGSKKEYGNNESSRKDPKKKDGFFKDGCPISLMFPIIAEDECSLFHYQDYIDEMFKDCDPY